MSQIEHYVYNDDELFGKSRPWRVEIDREAATYKCVYEEKRKSYDIVRLNAPNDIAHVDLRAWRKVRGCEARRMVGR